MIPNYIEQTDHPINEVLLLLVDEAYEKLKILNDEELKVIHDQFGWFHREMLINAPFKNEKYTTGVYSVIYEVNRLNFDYQKLIEQKKSQSAVLKIYPELQEHIDDDGLLILGNNFEPMHFGIGYKKHILYYSKFLRKQYSGQFLPEFIHSFLSGEKRENAYRIAIDHSRLILKEHLQDLLELDHWEGPKFNIADIDDPKSVGFTVVGRSCPPMLETTKTLDRTEFLWEMKSEKIKQLLIEEVSHLDNKLDGYYINRAIHCERDITLKHFTHFDGAVYIYDESSFIKRKSLTIKERLKPTKKIKLFRVDGIIDNQQTLDNICLYFRNNEMLIEYFDEELFNTKFKSKADAYLTWLRKKENAV